MSGAGDGPWRAGGQSCTLGSHSEDLCPELAGSWASQTLPRPLRACFCGVCHVPLLDSPRAKARAGAAPAGAGGRQCTSSSRKHFLRASSTPRRIALKLLPANCVHVRMPRGGTEMGKWVSLLKSAQRGRKPSRARGTRAAARRLPTSWISSCPCVHLARAQCTETVLETCKDTPREA